MIDFLRVGIIVNTHGLKGEVKVKPTTDDIERFDYLDEIILDNGKNKINTRVKSVKYLNKFVVLGFEGFNSINEVEGLRNYDIMVDRDNAIELDEDENFIGDLIGCKVYEGEKYIGKIKDVLFTKANDVYVIDYEGKEILIPVIKDCVLDIDIYNQKIEVKLPKGLIE